jgi:hypothetical protein
MPTTTMKSDKYCHIMTNNVNYWLFMGNERDRNVFNINYLKKIKPWHTVCIVYERYAESNDLVETKSQQQGKGGFDA